MIKPVEENALNLSSKLYVKCLKCGFEDTMAKIPPIDVNNHAEIDDLKDFPCPNCGTMVWEDDKMRQAKETVYKPVTRIPCIDCKRNGINSTQIRTGSEFICETRPTHRTIVRKEHN